MGMSAGMGFCIDMSMVLGMALDLHAAIVDARPSDLVVAAILVSAFFPPLILTIVNLLTWPRGRDGARFPGRVSVLIPARNEAANIAACVDSVLASRLIVDEVLVYDDDSSDGTSEILASIAERCPRVVVVPGRGLPAGWNGKAHACARLADEAHGDFLVFLDADVRLHESGLERLASLFDRFQADVVTAVPRQRTLTFAERLIVPLLHLTYTSWLPLSLVRKSKDPRFLAANGQILAVTKEAYRAIGGFEAVRSELVDDMAFCRAAKRHSRTVLFADGFAIATCRMYSSTPEIIRGFSKNLYEGLGGRPWPLLIAMTLYGTAFVAPYVCVVLAESDVVRTAAWAGVAANVLLRGLLAVRFAQPPEGLVLHPISVVALLAIALNSWRWSARRRIEWRGRSYGATRPTTSERSET